MKSLSDKKKSDNLLLYFLASKFLKPFKKWELCQEGLIDEKGKEINLNQISLLDKFLIRVKKMVNENQLATFVTFLKENRSDELTKEKIMEQFDRKKRYIKIEREIFEVYAKNGITEEDYHAYLLEKMKYDKELMVEAFESAEDLI